jgi:hypothetical protein
MRTAQPTLFPAEFCDGCPLTACDERETDAACRTAASPQNDLHPGNWGVFEQRMLWAPGVAAIPHRVPLPELPAYITRVPREVGAQAVAALPASAVAISLHDFMLLTHAIGDGRSVRERLGLGVRQLVVIGADNDRVCDAHWQNWTEVVRRLFDQAPDLVVGPDLSFYESDNPAMRALAFHSHTAMYATLTKSGLAALVPFGWVYPSDVRRFVAWAKQFDVPGAFLDLQRRTPQAAFDQVISDLRAMRHRFPAGFSWLVNGVQRPKRIQMLRDVLGDVRFTSAGPWHEARNHNTFAPHSLAREPTAMNVSDAFSSSVAAMTTFAQASRRRPAHSMRRVRISVPSRAAAAPLAHAR